jgi:quercetin dioxygenase-like cupin family protein
MSDPAVSTDLTALRVRRIVTGHDADGLALVLADEALAPRGLTEDGGRTDAAFFPLWATHQMPVDISSPDALSRQREGSTTTTAGIGSGSVLRIGVLAPGARSPMHRTESLDYGICLEGECEMELDGGETVTVRAGDVVVQRGTNHRWHNLSDVPCRFAWILLDAQPATVDGHHLEASWSDG